jgi:hypothetical protein
MDAGKDKSRNFGLSQALANQVVRKAEISAPVLGVFCPCFTRCLRIAEIGQPAYLLSIVPGHLMTAVGKDEASARCFLKSA